MRNTIAGPKDQIKARNVFSDGLRLGSGAKGDAQLTSTSVGRTTSGAGEFRQVVPARPYQYPRATCYSRSTETPVNPGD